MRLSVLHAIDRSLYDVTVCCIKQKGVLGKEAERLGFKVDVLGVSDNWYNLFTTVRLYAFIKKNHFDIAQSSLFKANYHSRIAARLAGVPMIFAEEHGEHYEFKARRLRSFHFILADRILSHITNKVICPSENMKESLIQTEGIAEDKVSAIINAVEEATLRPSRSKEAMREELGIKEGMSVIGTIGTLSYAKAHEVLLQAFNEIIKANSSIVLLIVGDGPRKKELKQMACSLGIEKKVIFAGERLDVADLLQIMDVFVLSSRSEGLPITLLEAMYMGIPSVAPKIGGIAEVIEDDSTGLLFSYPNYRELASRITHLLIHFEQAKAISQAARKKIQDKFLYSRYVQELMCLYQGAS